MTTPTPNPPPIITADQIVERDDGRFQIGLHDDAPGPFPSRACALAVAISSMKQRDRVMRKALDI